MAIFARINKGIAGFSAFLALVLVGVSLWTFVSILYNVPPIPEQPENLGSNGNSMKDGAESIGPTPTNDYDDVELDGWQEAPDQSVCVSNRTTWDYTAKFEYMPETFKGIIVSFVWCAIIGGLMQLCSSMVLVCSRSKNVSHRAKYFVGMHFIAFVILLASFFTPVAYDRKVDKYYSTAAFSVKVIESITAFQENFITFIFCDLNSFYLFLCVDIIFSFFIMIFVCCLMRFDTDYLE